MLMDSGQDCVLIIQYSMLLLIRAIPCRSLPELQNYFMKHCLGTNLVLGPPEKFYRRNPSGTIRDVH